ncbi:MAG: hypothetical protein WBF90_31120 [Rivularia sp. (in: cyanobacteria)]
MPASSLFQVLGIISNPNISSIVGIKVQFRFVLAAIHRPGVGFADRIN